MRPINMILNPNDAEARVAIQRLDADLDKMNTLHGAGEIQWRTRPPKVSLRNIPGVIEALKALGLLQFLRTKEEINKEAILADPEAAQNVKGITISQGEDFVIKPHESELEEVA